MNFDKNFDLYILSKDDNTNEDISVNITKVTLKYYKDGNNTDCNDTNYKNFILCDDSGNNDCPDTNSSGITKISDINIDTSVKCIQVYIEGSYNFSNYEDLSSDNFSIRPYKYEILNNNEQITSGKDFKLTLQALDYNNNLTKDYNESIYVTQENKTVEVNWSEIKENCITGILKKEDDDTNFTDGEANITLSYNEIGELNTTVKENKNSEYAKVDSDDTDDKDRFISEKNIIIKIIPYKFLVKYIINSNDYNFTYYDTNLSKYANIDMNITVINEDNETTKNYNLNCYANDVGLNISLKKENYGRNCLSKLIYQYIDINNNYSNIIKKDYNSILDINYSKINFKEDNNGSTNIKINFNFEKNISNPSAPLKVKINEINISDNKINTNLNINEPDYVIFYYGNLNFYDIKTSKNENNVTLYTIIYDNNKSDNLKPSDIETLINWYFNNKHQKNDGNISKENVYFSKSYLAKDKIDSSKIEVTNVSINNGSIILTINRKDLNIKFICGHLLDKNLEWLWYNRHEEKEYNISEGSSCLEHFCFTITYDDEESTGSAGSGEFNGTKVRLEKYNSKAPKNWR